MADDNDVKDKLANTRIDYLVAALKGAIGTIPFASLVAEAVGAAIPNQRIDRMADVLQKTAARMDEVGAQVDDISDRFRSPEFRDVFEEAMLQAGKALSEERRQYIANLIFNGLTAAEFENARVKRLLFILHDLTDPELIWLNFAGRATQESQQELYRCHERVLDDTRATLGSSRSEREAAALRESFWQHLSALGLTTPTRGAALGELTELGRLLLREIGTPAEFDDDDLGQEES